MAFTTMNDDKLLFVDKIAHAPPFLNGGGGTSGGLPDTVHPPSTVVYLYCHAGLLPGANIKLLSAKALQEGL
jgi:hypothetical protein